MNLPDIAHLADEAKTKTTEAATLSELCDKIVAEGALSSDENLRDVVNAAAHVKTNIDAAEAMREERVGDLRRYLRGAEEVYAPIIKSGKRAYAALRGAITDYVVRQETTRAGFQDALEQALADGAPREALKELEAQVSRHEIPNIEGLGLKKKRKVVITDYERAIKWCIEHGRDDVLLINEKGLGEQDARDIPGIDVVLDVTPSITASKVLG